MVDRYFSFQKTFGREDNVITIIYKPQDALKKNLYIELEDLVYQIDELPDVRNVASLFTLSDIDLKAWIGDLYDHSAPWDEDSILKVLKYIQEDPSIGSRVLSKDLNYGAIIITLTDVANNHHDRTALINQIKALTAKTSPEWTYSGVSVLRTEYVSYMIRDNFLFLPPIAILLVCILSFLFRNWVQVLLPISTVLITVIWLLGFMGLLGLEINIMTYIVPTLLFIIGIGDAIHIQARFRENLSRGDTDPEKAMLLTMVQMSKVIFLTSLTTSIGFLALMTTSIKIVQEFGFEIAIGVMMAWLVSLLVVPSGILVLKGFQYQRKYPFSTLLEWLSTAILNKPWVFVIIPLMISAICIFKIKDISTDASLMDDLRPQNKLYHDLKLTEKYFGGVLPFEVLLHLDPSFNGAPKNVVDSDVLPFLNQIESLLRFQLKESRFFSI
jgi:predicted RND superfamily exporter protein